MRRLSSVLVLALVACSSSPSAEAVDSYEPIADLASNARAACDAWDPYAELDPATAELDPATAEPCDSSAGDWRACTTRACHVNGTAGVHYCSEVYGVDVPLWRACLLERCLACTPGDTKLCGPGTNYPDSLQKCMLSDGVPVWFDGDCTT